MLFFHYKIISTFLYCFENFDTSHTQNVKIICIPVIHQKYLNEAVASKYVLFKCITLVSVSNIFPPIFKFGNIMIMKSKVGDKP